MEGKCEAGLPPVSGRRSAGAKSETCETRSARAGSVERSESDTRPCSLMDHPRITPEAFTQATELRVQIEKGKGLRNDLAGVEAFMKLKIAIQCPHRAHELCLPRRQLRTLF